MQVVCDKQVVVGRGRSGYFKVEAQWNVIQWMSNSRIDARFVYLVHDLQLFGFASTEALVHALTLDPLIAELMPLLGQSADRSGLRNILDIRRVAELASTGPVRMIAESVLGTKCFAVRGILFDKTPDANWKVGWHQDTTIAVRERRETPGYGAWSEKAGVTHVSAPAEVLQRMISIRLNLDACDETNGPLRVLSATHRRGILNAKEIQKHIETDEPFAVACTAARGAMLVFKPLLLHASSPAAVPGHRRVIHLDFAADPLPDGLNWRWTV